MVFAAGSRVTAAALNRITFNELEALVSGDHEVTTTEDDISGASISVTTTQTNTKVLALASLDAELVGSGADFPFVVLNVDGTNEPDNLKFQVLGRETISCVWSVTLGSIGAHTIKLRADKIGTADTATIYATHSKLVVCGLGIS